MTNKTNTFDIPNVAPLTQRVVQALYRTRNLFWDHDRRIAEASGMSWGQVQTLISLMCAGPDHCLSPSQLYDTVQASSGGMTKMLSALEAAGYVERIPNPNDGRSRLVKLTKAGMTRISELSIAFGSVNTELLAAALNPSEQEALATALEKLGDRLAARR